VLYITVTTRYAGTKLILCYITVSCGSHDSKCAEIRECPQLCPMQSYPDIIL